MALSSEDRLFLTNLAQQRWLEAHVAFTAYQRGYRRNRQIGEWLRRLTLCGALVTAASTSHPGMQILTVASGLVTALLSALEQAYTPTKQAQKFWECRTALQGIKEDLVSAIIALRGVADIDSGKKIFDQVNVRFSEATREPYDELPIDKKMAATAFRESALVSMIQAPEPASGEDDYPDASLGSDAPDVIAVSRPRAAKI